MNYKANDKSRDSKGHVARIPVPGRAEFVELGGTVSRRVGGLFKVIGVIASLGACNAKDSGVEATEQVARPVVAAPNGGAGSTGSDTSNASDQQPANPYDGLSQDVPTTQSDESKGIQCTTHGQPNKWQSPAPSAVLLSEAQSPHDMSAVDKVDAVSVEGKLPQAHSESPKTPSPALLAAQQQYLIALETAEAKWAQQGLSLAEKAALRQELKANSMAGVK